VKKTPAETIRIGAAAVEDRPPLWRTKKRRITSTNGRVGEKWCLSRRKRSASEGFFSSRKGKKGGKKRVPGAVKCKEGHSA